MSEWGPWIEHDGKGCPCVGMWVQAEYDVPPRGPFAHGSVSGKTWEGRARGRTSWVWPDFRGNIIRYRIRKPRGMTILENLIADLPAPVRKVEA